MGTALFSIGSHASPPDAQAGMALTIIRSFSRAGKSKVMPDTGSGPKGIRERAARLENAENKWEQSRADYRFFLICANANNLVMKILVPTDFSENAAKALRFAISITNRLGGSITLYHVYRIGSSAAETFKSKLGEIMREDKLNALQALIDQYREYQRKGTLETRAAVGDRVDLIVDRADKNAYDLICMGISGESAVDDFFMGNTAVGVMRNASTPILVIPKEANPIVLKTIVLAVDQQGISTPGLLKQLVAFAKIQGTVVKVYHQATEGQPDAIPPSVAAELEGLHYTYHSEIPDTSHISEGIQHFVKQQDADLLCLIRRRRGFLSRLFSENVSRDSLFDSKIPILIVKD